uniref:EF-hand domain-containing protein n=1 Tax=Chlamydomonas chlamydogama TaxID=225041 RepID=A0A7S2QT81_9CHLO|mmetsp:Transcript_1314/g.2853  ORF Transcript_1314/g.2853 Transcript_1314/m.2853 type:complete len:478 (+) Transcript_1314:950-2383(+)|eukprot:CAMPEP_0202920292 /NCGR_PEP_ID=MMETSP1392-20130828/76778_1 /ASSEMBLY_ACC=CAM_ASM_000868 /TAXON_ID=225041 /ORGANISM="Chlamydomonas chlamydogama, Strain SAG 11-48b" /LENGTH=477 /DNA_ID=CAMNT_0049613779 /DNA_START=945 /DNA_END=2378 /DNA_ORIENTATION=-
MSIVTGASPKLIAHGVFNILKTIEKGNSFFRCASTLSSTVSSSSTGQRCVCPGQPAAVAVAYKARTEHKQHTHHEKWWFGAIVGSAALSFAATPALCESIEGDVEDKAFLDEQSRTLLSLDTRQRLFFKYEKRIRDNSPLDKVFDYFASQERDGVKYMVPADLLRAVVPTYPASESKSVRGGSLDGERKAKVPGSKRSTSFFQQFDVDGDGLISYLEYLLVLTLLSIPENDVKTIFNVVDLDSNGVLDAEEFAAIIKLLQNMASVQAGSVGRPKLKPSSESGLLVTFFGHDQKGKLQLAEFTRFLSRLHEELVRLEFEHYDVQGRGYIPAIDFARSLVASAHVKKVDALLDKVSSLESQLGPVRISFQDFAAVHALHRHWHKLLVSLDFIAQVGRTISQDDLQKLLIKVAGVKLSKQALDIIMLVFDDGTGKMDTGALLEVLQRREYMWSRRHEGSEASKSKLQRVLGCMKKCYYDL